MAPMSHTPLESFLLLRALQPLDGSPKVPSFERASEVLKSDELLLQCDDRSEDRLEPDRLKDLYLRLLKEQAKFETSNRQASPARDANPRKRKLSSPPVESLDDASTYSYLLPNLFERLYIQYKEDTIKAIEEEERQFRTLQKQVQALELQTSEEAKGARPSAQGVPPISALLRETEETTRPPRRPIEAQTNGVTDVIPGQPGNLHADIYKPVSQPGSADNAHPPYLPPPPAPPSQNYSLPTSAGIDRRSSISNQRHSSSPHARQAPLPQSERSPASPIILPPPKGMVRASGSPPMPSPQQNHYPPPRQPTNQHQPPRQPYPYDNQSYYAPYAQTPVPIYHPHGGNMQPYHMPPSHTPYSPHYGAQSYQPPAASQHSAYYGPHSQYAAAPSQTPYAKPTPSYYENRPQSQTSATPRPPKLSPIVTKLSSTKWKKFDDPRGFNTPGSPTRPRSRDISPISDPGSDTQAANAEDEDQPARAEQNTRSESNEPVAHSVPARRGRGGRGRGSMRGRRGRAASSSTVPDSRRSHSAADEASSIKNEAQTIIDDSASMASLTADEASRKSVRQRRGAIRSVETEQPRLKRKRDEEGNNITPRRRTQNMDSPALPPPTPHRQPTRPGFVLATRNFSRITAQLMNEITSHRLASLFAKPLTERDAPGYKNLIRRPQDLKSIRGAISAGGRALAAHLEELGDSAGAGAHIWVPESEDFFPPKGIVNAAQLEKELMRLFANAVMFNPDTPENRGLGPAFRTRKRLKAENESGNTSSTDEADNKFERGVAAPQEGDMVNDTRDVARDVQEAFAAWRAVEREREDDIAVVAREGEDAEGGEGNDESDEEVKESVEVEEDGGRRSKRRKR